LSAEAESAFTRVFDALRRRQTLLRSATVGRLIVAFMFGRPAGPCVALRQRA
jgi:hypothetical protein